MLYMDVGWSSTRSPLYTGSWSLSPSSRYSDTASSERDLSATLNIREVTRAVQNTQIRLNHQHNGNGKKLENWPRQREEPRHRIPSPSDRASECGAGPRRVGDGASWGLRCEAALHPLPELRRPQLCFRVSRHPGSLRPLTTLFLFRRQLDEKRNFTLFWS